MEIVIKGSETKLKALLKKEATWMKRNKVVVPEKLDKVKEEPKKRTRKPKLDKE